MKIVHNHVCPSATTPGIPNSKRLYFGGMPCRCLIAAVFVALTGISLSAQDSPTAEPHPAPPPLLYLWISPVVTNALGAEGAGLIEELHSALAASGIPSVSMSDAADDSAVPGRKVLAVVMPPDSESSISALLISGDEWPTFRSGNSSHARTLVTVPLDQSGSTQALETLMMKIVESLRSSALCHVVIESEPSRAAISLDKIGFSGATPVELLVWPDTLNLLATYPRYLKTVRVLPMPTPGHYSLVLQLKKRRIYHSPFFVPSLVCFAGSVAAFAAESHYFNKYHSLGADDLRDSPDSFSATFDRAKTAEYVAFAALGLGMISLSLSLLF